MTKEIRHQGETERDWANLSGYLTLSKSTAAHSIIILSPFFHWCAVLLLPMHAREETCHRKYNTLKRTCHTSYTSHLSRIQVVDGLRRRRTCTVESETE